MKSFFLAPLVAGSLVEANIAHPHRHSQLTTPPRKKFTAEERALARNNSKRIFIVRHGESTWTKASKWIPHNRLNEKHGDGEVEVKEIDLENAVEGEEAVEGEGTESSFRDAPLSSMGQTQAALLGDLFGKHGVLADGLQASLADQIDLVGEN